MSEKAIDSKWLAVMQNEIGVLHTNIMRTDLELEAALASLVAKDQIIDSLSERCRIAEASNEDLKERLQPRRKEKRERRERRAKNANNRKRHGGRDDPESGSGHDDGGAGSNTPTAGGS